MVVVLAGKRVCIVVERVFPAFESCLSLDIGCLQVMNSVPLVITMHILVFLLPQKGLLLQLDLLLKLLVDVLVLKVVILVNLVFKGFVLVGILVKADSSAMLDLFFELA